MRKSDTNDAAPVAENGETPPVVRRRRRRTKVDLPSQTQVLIHSLLASRAGRGATQHELQGVIDWARGIHTETEALKTYGGRPRRAKTPGSSDRTAALQLNQSLLDGVIAGRIGLDVDEAGAIVFLARDNGNA